MTPLPPYAFPYQHPAAERGDVGAEFRGDDGGSITVAIERTEGAMLLLQTNRSGLGENCFTKNELGRVLELAYILYAANGKQPEREKFKLERANYLTGALAALKGKPGGKITIAPPFKGFPPEIPKP